jgi:uncharacterized protein (DUF433 family)
VEVLSGTSVIEVVERYGVVRQTVHRWVARDRAEGLDGLADRSHAPRQHPWRIPGEIQALSCELRRAQRRWVPRRLVFEVGRRGYPDLAPAAVYDHSVTFSRITADPGVLGGQPCIRGTRVAVATVVAKVADGMTIAEITADFPDLTSEDVIQALRFAAEAVRDGRRAETPSAGEDGRELQVADSPRLALYIGDGLAYGTTWVFGVSRISRLEFYGWGIRIQAGAIASRLGSRYELCYDEILEARPAGTIIRQGVRFRAACLQQPVTFITVDFREILDRLEQRNVPVSRRTVSMRFWFSV